MSEQVEQVEEVEEIEIPEPTDGIPESQRLALPAKIEALLFLSNEPLTTAQLASSTQMHERTLRKYCTRHRLPPPQQIVGWSRLLIAAFYLDEGSRSTKDVADLLGFPTTDALRKQLMRYTHRSATHLRDGHAVNAVARLMETELAAQGSNDGA